MANLIRCLKCVFGFSMGPDRNAPFTRCGALLSSFRSWHVRKIKVVLKIVSIGSRIGKAYFCKLTTCKKQYVFRTYAWFYVQKRYVVVV